MSASMEATVEVAVATTLTQLSEQGYSDHFVVDVDGAVCCPVCGVCVAADGLHPDETHRLEDGSLDAAVVLAVRCLVCRAQGAAVAWTGAPAGRGDEALLGALGSRAATAAPPRG